MEPKNFLHEHPLHFFEKWSYNVHGKTRGVKCSSGCGQPISAQFYSCIDCKFFLHKSCSELPLDITHPFHDNHPLTLFAITPHRRKFARCHFCGNRVTGFVYRCSSCEFDLDIKCALLPEFLNGDFPKVDHHIHVEHPLSFIENLSPRGVKLASSRYCSVCLEKLSDASFYTCLVCELFLHKPCSETEPPLNINHPFHRKHTLTLTLLKRDSAVLCQFCHNNRYLVGLFYHCSSCRFNLHIRCAFLPQFVTENFPKRDHLLSDVDEHPLFFIQKDLISDSNRVELRSDCFVCPESLADCTYVLHGRCVKKNKDRLYIEVESENEESDDEASSSSSCAVALGDKIDHFSHEHELVLDKEEIIMNGDKKCCDGCVLPILEAAYSCPQPECNFSLHKACAQIGEYEPHWASRDPLQVSMELHFKCLFCKHFCSGFSSWIDDGHFYSKICLRCIEIPFTTTHEAHAQHSLFCDKEHKGPCSGCGKEMGDCGGYRCTLAEEEENCKFFALDYRCLTRPLTAQHRFHHHPLKLTYKDPYKDDDGDPFQHMCEICEDRRDPKLWFYRCDECDFDAHPDCVLGDFPFIKRGSIFDYYKYYKRCDSHQRQSLIYFQSEKYPYPKCGACGHPCKDQLALKCPHSECDFVSQLESSKGTFVAVTVELSMSSSNVLSWPKTAIIEDVLMMICWVCFLKITDSATGNEDFVLDSMVCDSNLRLIPNQKDGEEEIYTMGCLYHSFAINPNRRIPLAVGNLIRFGGAGSEASIHLHLDH
ncbi:hypothetical protein SLEP1_g51619 [Rubroshorea leprosula]|uniref:DC1 domain-containing protein n=1 Tax=Rubroshorea leprosula TaxID=152421 RepID=A0AAV5M3R7_9ROSI|nr:hypothetical protein SLEP1_g51619 [Rubroshorea leprosula]